MEKQMAGLTNIKVERFKSLYDVDIPLGQVNVFVGANGAGKSNLLEAFGVIGAAAAGRVDDQALLRRGVRPGVPRIYKSAFPSAKKDPSIRITLSMGESSYFIGIANQGNVPQPFWYFQTEKLIDNGVTIASRGPRTGKAKVHGDTIHDERSASLAMQARANLKTTQVTREFLANLDDYAIFAPVTPVLRGIAPDTAPRAPVGLFGGALPEAVESLSADPKKRLREQALNLIEWAEDFSVGPPSKNFIASSVPTMRRVILFRDAYMRKADQTLSGYDASEGALYVLYMLCLAMHPQAPRIFAVDNFDQALNPAAARQLTRVFCEQVLRHERQVLLTTHNPLVLDGLPLDDDRVRLFKVERGDNGRSIIQRIPVKDLRRVKMKYGNNAVSRLWIEGRLGGLSHVRKI
jgi:energy-coupling factor transporter ATP-binding protein EcfA2